MNVQRIVIATGVIVLLVGIAWPLLSRAGLGRLPGDFMFRRDGVSFYLPLTTCIIISLVLSAVFWLLHRF